MSGHAKIGPDIAKVWLVKQYLANIWVGKPKYGEIVPMLRSGQVCFIMHKDMYKSWSGMPRYGQIIFDYAKIWPSNAEIWTIYAKL